MVKIELAGVMAIIENYEWASDNKHLQDALNAMLDPLGPSGADPYPDLTAATEAMEKLGGEVVEYDEPKDDTRAGAVE